MQTYGHCSQSTLYCRIGKINKESIEWHGREREYCRGKISQVAVNDVGVVVSIHDEGPQQNLCYLVGKLNTTDSLVEWQSKASFASGKNPCVALNSRGVVVVVYERGTFRKHLYCRVGDVDDSNGVICWRGEEQRVLEDTCWRPSAALNDHNVVVIGFTSTTSRSFLIGKINSEQRSTTVASNPTPVRVSPKQASTAIASESRPAVTFIYVPGAGERQSDHHHHVVIGLNNHGHLLTVHAANQKVFFYNGRLDQNQTPTESTLRKSEAGLSNIAHIIRSSSVAVNNRNFVVFTCDVAHGMLKKKRVVFTAMEKLMPFK